MTGREALVRDLAAVPGLLATAARAAPPPPPGEWSAREVVCHLIAVEGEVWHVRLDSLWGTTDEPQWAWTEPGPWDGPGSETLDGALQIFATRRAATVERLARLDDAGWRRTGLHPTYGRPGRCRAAARRTRSRPGAPDEPGFTLATSHSGRLRV